MNPREYFEWLLDQMPPGLDRAVLSILRFHVGLDQSIEKEPLILAVDKIGFPIKDERQVRLAIVRLRKSGVPVCSSSTEAGYFLPSTLEEYYEFRGREYVKKIIDMRSTVEAMDGNARRLFAKEYQAFVQAKAAQTGQPALL